MGIHFDGRAISQDRSAARRLHSSAVSSDGSQAVRIGEPDAALLRAGLPPLPPIESWLIEPGEGREKPEDNSRSIAFNDQDSTLDTATDNPDSTLKETDSDALADSDGQLTVQSAAQRQSIPRLVFKPAQAVAVMLILMAALCASLTMLVTQAINYNKQQAEASSSASLNAGTAAHGQAAKRQHGKASKSDDASPSSQSPGSAGSAGQGGGAATPANPSAGTGKATGQAGASAGSSDLVNINTADSTRLQQIKGVGPVMAQKIIDYRSSIGRFTSVDQLLKVSGIGQKTLEKIRGQVTV
ncbi:helix-hairpin-helix domain-containing protein [Bifidobacterium sp. ESL0704]|uniref:ComEA family DNA-binding protein n=1 Tax=Bifidobacterium sp. ESL0704 TaxID=2983219 RepID=UPI0023F6E863|nr:helix-hairpin-helix domain-containing protein [Bifidobacterium sp. ESL0704]WEV52193.1 helix-hairpin-helix domain-containing protein [Bifidobacterium sp. ESL0704]